MDEDGGWLLQAQGIRKTFGHVEALRGADFGVRESEVVALIGDNGAGKSTLVKILSGALAPDEGSLTMAGRGVEHRSTLDARACGVETVYQDLALADDLSAPANLFLGRELLRDGILGRLGFLDKAAMRVQAEAAFAGLEIAIPSLEAPVASMSGGQRQGVAVSRAVTWASRVVFMDEPTAALGVRQTRGVLDLIRRVRDRGIAVVLISHNMPEVLEVADRVQVLRLGQRVASFDARHTTVQELVGAMTGALDGG
jgi:simple sugar transport system ATP-binding protein